MTSNNWAEIFEWSVDEAGVTIIECLQENATSVEVPSEIDEKPVVALAVGSFKDCGELSRVSLPSSLQTIGAGAFSGCSSLVEVLVSPKNANFRSVDGVLFSADGKTLILYPAGRQEEEYVVPDGVVEIAVKAFEDSASLVSVTFPEGLQTIGDSAFWRCSSLISVSFSEGLQTIGYRAFSGCSSLTSVTLPEGLQTIGDEAFWRCSSLTSVTLPEGLQTIGDSAFWDCSSDLTLRGVAGTYAEKYAAENGLRFEAR